MTDEPGAFKRVVKGFFAPPAKPCPGGYRGRILMEKKGYPIYECLCPESAVRDCTCYDEKVGMCAPEGFVHLPVL